MTCKGICMRHKASSHYGRGNKSCQVCEIFIKRMHCSVLAVDID